jgi:hypothetical protein
MPTLRSGLLNKKFILRGSLDKALDVVSIEHIFLVPGKQKQKGV